MCLCSGCNGSWHSSCIGMVALALAVLQFLLHWLETVMCVRWYGYGIGSGIGDPFMVTVISASDSEQKMSSLVLDAAGKVDG